MKKDIGNQVAASMGWKQKSTNVWRGANGVWYETVPEYNDGAIYLFYPSTCERSAGLVQDRIAALGWVVTVHTGPDLIFCCIARMDAKMDLVQVEAKTRPMAICLAFVEAMERWGDE